MAGTSGIPGAPNGWLSGDDFGAELGQLGCVATPGLLEDWREARLLPAPIQVPNYVDGRVSGSTVWHDPGSPRQVLAVERALTVTKRFNFAGAALWSAGFPVGEDYWRPGLETSDTWMRRTALAALWFLRREGDNTLGDEIADPNGLGGLLAKARRRLTEDGEVTRLINVGHEIVAGRFEHLDPGTEGEVSTETVVHAAMDIGASSRDQIMGRQLKLQTALPPVLSAISASQHGLRLDAFSQSEIEAARDDVRNGLRIGICLYEAMSWIYGPQAFGLRMFVDITRLAAARMISIWTLGFARLRRSSLQLYSSEEIAKLADQAEATWLMSLYFRDLNASHPELRRYVDPKRVKLAFSDSFEHQKWRKELAGYEFPKPDFRPWDQWQKLSKSKASTGLLAMSIGAPSKVEFADLLQRANVAPNP